MRAQGLHDVRSDGEVGQEDPVPALQVAQVAEDGGGGRGDEGEGQAEAEALHAQLAGHAGEVVADGSGGSLDDQRQEAVEHFVDLSLLAL